MNSLCKCGCGERTKYYKSARRFRDYVHGHNKRGKKFASTSEKLRKRWKKKGERARFSALMKGRKITWAHKISASIKAGYASMTARQRRDRALAVLRASTVHPNKAETKLWGILKRNFPNEFRLNVKGQTIIGGRVPDFVNVNGKKVLVEMFGDYWHRKEKTGRNRSQEVLSRKKYFAKWGFKTVVVWQKDLKNERLVVEKLHEILS